MPRLAAKGVLHAAKLKEVAAIVAKSRPNSTFRNDCSSLSCNNFDHNLQGVYTLPWFMQQLSCNNIVKLTAQKIVACNTCFKPKVIVLIEWLKAVFQSQK